MILRLVRAAPLLATLAATGWALSTNPLAAPLVERGATDLILTLEHRVRRTATAPWIEAELAAAVASEDVDRAAMLIDLARDLERDIDLSAAEAMIAAREGWLASAGDCAACMADIAACPTLAHLASCAVPFEMSPLGDANALRRAGVAWASGAEVDRLDAGLALVGLAATGAVLVTGGTSVTVKAGAGLLRTARRMGSLTPSLARHLTIPVRWSAVPAYLRGAAPLDTVTDMARLSVATAIAADMGRVREATSTAEALRLARLVDTPTDAARLARVAEAMGPRTGRTLAVLGKGRAFRATLRLSRAAAGTLALAWLCMVQIGAILAARLGAAVLRALTPAPRAMPGARAATPALGPAGPRPRR
ncbi:hypothetical protein MWU52_11165 [Jannaschia sp. S6380]|uniref:hypothetical protein n=1 Tax=Jannaschia sp. S6380 TaxID=2926408 RepID=UPI001FF367B3|nr:hypothetical protein [Jannaschia sp. S6380]MCK0168113.1 hypothetical protein [Jannaschia sp. S6380]